MPFLIPLLAPIGAALSGGTLAGTAAAIAGGTALAGTGAGIAGSVIGAGPKTTTTTPTLTPAMSNNQDQLIATIQKMMADPTGGLSAQRSADSGAINTAYAGMPNTITQMLASRGFGSSGKVGDAVYNTEGARLGAQSNLYGQYAALGSQRQLTATQIMDQIINANRGEAKTTPGQGLAAGLLSGGESLLGLLNPTPGAAGGAGGSSAGGSILQNILKGLKVSGSGYGIPNDPIANAPAAPYQSATPYQTPSPSSMAAPAVTGDPLSSLAMLHTMLTLGGSGTPQFSGSGWAG
jgi:hypothetical protein